MINQNAKLQIILVKDVFPTREVAFRRSAEDNLTGHGKAA